MPTHTYYLSLSILFYFYSVVPMEFSPMGNSGRFPRGKPAAAESCYPTWINYWRRVCSISVWPYHRLFRWALIISEISDSNDMNNIDRRIDLNLSKSVQSAAGLKLWRLLPISATWCANHYPTTLYINIYIYIIHHYCTEVHVSCHFMNESLDILKVQATGPSLPLITCGTLLLLLLLFIFVLYW